MELSDTINENRKSFISYLRTNPLGLTQKFDGSLSDENEECVCAIGLGCRYFGIDTRIEYHHGPDYDPYVDGPYAKFAEAVGIDFTGADGIDKIWQWNDRNMLPFARIADLCEEWWFGNV